MKRLTAGRSLPTGGTAQASPGRTQRISLRQAATLDSPARYPGGDRQRARLRSCRLNRLPAQLSIVSMRRLPAPSPPSGLG